MHWQKGSLCKTSFVGHLSSKFHPNLDGKQWQSLYLPSFSLYLYIVLNATSHLSIIVALLVIVKHYSLQLQELLASPYILYF